MDLQNLCSELADTVGKRTAELVRIQMLGALKQAVRWQILMRNPAEAVTPIKVPKQEITVWTPSEAARFLDTARTHRLYATFYLLMSTGLRRGELLALKWSDLTGHRLVVQTSKTRKGKRTLKLSLDVLEVLEAWRDRQRVEVDCLGIPQPSLMFTSETGTAIHPRNLERVWKQLQKQTREVWKRELEKALEASNGEAEREAVRSDLKQLEAGRLFPTLRLHDLRHLHASMLISGKKLSPVEVADRLGHVNPSFTMDVYGHLFREHFEEDEVSLLDYLPTTGTLNQADSCGCILGVTRGPKRRRSGLCRTLFYVPDDFFLVAMGGIEPPTSRL